MFKKKNKVTTIKPDAPKASVLGKGTRTIKDFFAPPSFDRSHEDFMKVGGKYVRSFVMNGFPSNVSVTWLDHILHYDGDMDTAIYVVPADERTALDEITKKITQFEAQLEIEQQKGSNRNTTRLGNTIAQLYAQRERLEQNYESIFHIMITSNLYTNSLEELNKQTQKLDNKLKGRKMDFMPEFLLPDDSYKTALPFGKNYIDDKFRNFNSSAVTACFPFYNSEISHENGVLCGVNLSTMTPIYIDFYNDKLLANGNMTVFGTSGSGKTFFVSMLTMRTTLKGVRSVIIDPEREYSALTHALGGGIIVLSPRSKARINVFDIEEVENKDGSKEVPIKDKVADILNLIAVMAEGTLTPEQRSLVSYVIAQVYEDKGFTEDPKSLYVSEPQFDEKTGEFFHDGVKKTMPTFSDFHEKLVQFAERENNKVLTQLANALKMFKKGGVYDLFDCQTSPELKDFQNSPVVTFDVYELEESILRPIGMYVALSWTWEKFIKKNPYIQKRIVVDEAWMFMSKNMAGSKYTAAFLENAARRIRKRNGTLLVASQNFKEFSDNPQGQTVLTNAKVNIFLGQNATDIDGVQTTFKLSDGERNFLLSAKKGQYLLRMNGESSVGYALAFPYEKSLIERAKSPKK